jgi:ActR/RegA family two-component response regulator
VKTVLIIESDLGFVFWLGRALQDASYEALPAKGVQEATALVSELNAEIDLLIVNPSLAGAVEFVHALRHSRRDLKILAVPGEKDQQAHPIPSVDAVVWKPPELDQAASALWLSIVGQLLLRDCAARISY